MWIALLGIALHLGLSLLWPYRPSAPLFLAGVALGFGFLALAYRGLHNGSLSWRWLLVTALLLRAVWFVQPAGLSEDIYRYLWDGQLSAQGINPYPLAPEELTEVRRQHPDLYSRMAHQDRTSIYPPLAQFLFWANHLLWGASAMGWKIWLLLAEMLLLWFLKRTGILQAHTLSLWLLNPLVVIEFYSSGHLDLIALALLTGALVVPGVGKTENGKRKTKETGIGEAGCQPTSSPRGHLGASSPPPFSVFRSPFSLWISPLLLSLATLIKLFPALFFPLLVSQQGSLRATLRYAALFALGLILPTAAFLALRGLPAASWEAFADITDTFRDIWRFNSLPVLALHEYRFTLRPILEKVFVIGLLAIVLGPSLRRLWQLQPRKQLSQCRDWLHRELQPASLQSLTTSFYFILMLLYVCSHTMHPWYVTWCLLAYPILGMRYWAGIYLSAASFLSYLAYWFEPEGERLWVLWVEYLPFYVLLLRDIWMAWGRGSGAPGIEFEP